MKKINLLILKKRFFPFLLLIFSTFFMNLFLWNETSQLVRQLPTIVQLKKLSFQNIYEVNYLPNANSQGKIKEHSEVERKDLASFLKSFPSLYSNKKAYINARGNDVSILTPVTKNMIEEYILVREMDIAFLNDLIFLDFDDIQVNEFKNQAEKTSIKINLLSMKERYIDEYNYYVKNFIFGLTISLLLLSFSIFLIYIIISASIKIAEEEIKLLRVVGLSKNKIKRNFESLLIFPIVLTSLLFFVFIHSISIPVIFADYVYLFILNSCLCLVSKYIIYLKIYKGEYYA